MGTISFRRVLVNQLEELGLGHLAKDVGALSFNAVSNLAWLLEQNRLKGELPKVKARLLAKAGK